MSTSIYNQPSVFHRPEFIQNKYFDWYLSIISKAKLENRRKGSGIYYEEHHVLPQSIYPEYIKSKWNLVLLTGKEHFICHKLLTKFVLGENKKKMWFALNSFLRRSDSQERVKITSSEYQRIKENFAKYISEHNKIKLKDYYRNRIHHSKGRIETEETRMRKSISLKEAFKDKQKCPMYGKTHSDETKKKMSISSSGKKNYRFKGYYITPWGKFESISFVVKANELAGVGLIKGIFRNLDRIISKCSYSHSIYLQSLGEGVIGKSFREIGFDFEEV